jgi:energy-coupling factor transporter ATP-binding protein EcfA2
MAVMNTLEVKDLSYSYPDGKPALRGVSMYAAAGECVGIVGPNGAGKSTLLLHLNGILPEDDNRHGEVVICGDRITNSNLHAVHRMVGLLFQDPDDQLFCPTVSEDVAFGPVQFGFPAGEIDRIVRESLRQVGLEGFERRSPHHLSGGEKQRVCLAGLLTCNPSILVLDEPTSDLDPRGRRELARLIRGLPATRVIASHDLELVLDLCSRVYLLDGGEVVAGGPAVKIFSDEELMVAHGLEKPHSLQHRHPHP